MKIRRVVPISFLFALGLAAQPLVETGQGQLRGRTDGTVDRFLGVPFAAPPVGDLRWKPPASPAKWTGIRNAFRLGDACVQMARGGKLEGSEDCLYLNVYRPAAQDVNLPKPVLVFIHGGSNQRGSGGEYDPSGMVAENGLVVVTVNYRLNVFGFLALPALDTEMGGPGSGNYGFQDQQAALRWVHDNIRSFGGDPNNVTVQGESAGAIDICAHLAAPGSAGLFRKAIMESGYCPLTTHDQALAVGAQVTDAVGCSDAGCLRAKTPEELITAVPLSVVPGGGKGFNASPNAGNLVLPVAPAAAIESGQWNQMPLMIGSNHDEMALFAGPLLLASRIRLPLGADGYESLITMQFKSFAPQVLAEYPVDTFPSPFLAYSGVLTDLSPLGCGTTKMTQNFAGRALTFRYEFNDQAAPLIGPLKIGAYHGAELQYLFSMTRLNGRMTGEQKEMARQMRAYWANFARSGDPNADGLVYWPVYDNDARRMLSLQPAGATVETDFDTDHHCAFWAAAPPRPY